MGERLAKFLVILNATDSATYDSFLEEENPVSICRGIEILGKLVYANLVAFVGQKVLRAAVVAAV